jgi:hypothetical protein
MEHLMCCPKCHRHGFKVYRDTDQGEYVLRCEAGHEVKRFFVLVAPEVPERPTRSEYAAAAHAD